MEDVIEAPGHEQQAGPSGNNPHIAAAPKDSNGSLSTAPKLPIKPGNRFGLPPMTDDFIMFEWKVSPCPKTYGHDWSVCPCAHPNEKTRRRSPKMYPYKPDICPDMKESNHCPRGDNCLMSHSIYEYHLHPARFHTELCRMGTRCTRALCFFAHSLQELRAPHPNIHMNSSPVGSSFGPSPAGVGPQQQQLGGGQHQQAGVAPQQQQSGGGMTVILHAPVLGMQAGQGMEAGISTSSALSDSASLMASTQLQQVRQQQQQQQQQPIMLGGHGPPSNGWQQGRQQYAQMGQPGNAAGGTAPGQVAPHVVRTMLAQLASLPGNPNPGAALNAINQLQAELAGLSVSAASAAMYAGPPSGQRPVMLQAVDGNGLAIAPAYGVIETAPMSQAMLAQCSLPQLQHQQILLPQQQQVMYQMPYDGLQLAPAGLMTNNPTGGGVMTTNNPAGGGYIAMQQQVGPVVAGTYQGTMGAAGDLPPGIIYQQVPQGFAASSMQPMIMQPQQQQQPQVVLVPMHMGGHMWQ